jgi:hypothetical protein
MSWKECSVIDERIRFAARRPAGEPMAELWALSSRLPPNSSPIPQDLNSLEGNERLDVIGDDSRRKIACQPVCADGC